MGGWMIGRKTHKLIHIKIRRKHARYSPVSETSHMAMAAVLSYPLPTPFVPSEHLSWSWRFTWWVSSLLKARGNY